ncbi:MAG: helix-turn-helix transcriptional regulator [Oligoflexales bacterium]|nr:helix-turn-helix transcriptional regulator [Oligoflexales bacterium]
MTIDEKDYVRAQEVLPSLSFAELIESIREDLNIEKRVDMARQLGVTKQYYSDFLSGRSHVSVKKAVEWAKILGYPDKLFIKYALDDLLSRNELNYSVQVHDAIEVKA